MVATPQYSGKVTLFNKYTTIMLNTAPCFEAAVAMLGAKSLLKVL
jgi:hypothetical protein